MAKNKFLIAPLKAGLENRLPAWLIQDEAYAILNNAYVWRGRLKKRFGTLSVNNQAANSELNSRLRINIGTTSGAGALGFTNLPLNTGDMAAGQAFSIGTEIFTVTALGNPATVITTASGTMTLDTTASPATVSVTGTAATTDVFFYPALPVQHFAVYEDYAEISNEPTYAWDTRFAYQWVGSGATAGWGRLGTAVWSGTNADFYDTLTWRGSNPKDNILFAVNNVSGDSIQYWDGSSWTAFTPSITGAATLTNAGFVTAFKGRLLFLNTIEGGDRFPNRLRFSSYSDPLSTNTFRQDIPGNGGFIDLEVSEAITGVAYLRDRLIVSAEKSTWEVAWTQNQVTPFIFRQISDNFGCESNNSTVTYDNFMYQVGNVGITQTSGSNVQRIDEEIPEEVFEINNTNSGPARVQAARDYFDEVIYWTMPQVGFGQGTFPNRVLVYNYKNKTFAFNDDSITAFGYFENRDNNTQQNLFPFVIGGNQQGYTFLIVPNLPLLEQSFQITDFQVAGTTATVTSYNHNLNNDSYIYIQNIEWDGTLVDVNNFIFKVTTTGANTFTITIPAGTSGTYLGGGTYAWVSRIDVKTKQYNFYVSQGQEAAVSKIDFLAKNSLVENTGQITVEPLVSSSDESITSSAGTLFDATVGTSVLDYYAYTTLFPFEATQDRFWHPVYVIAQGEVVQFRIYWTDTQMTTAVDGKFLAHQLFEVQSWIIHASPTNPVL